MNIKQTIRENPVQFSLTVLSSVIGIIALIVYLTTGIIRNYTEQYSAGLITFAVLGIVINILTVIKRIHMVETLPFVAYIIATLLFLTANANYLVAVVRAIDITSVSASFVWTIVLFLLASLIQLAGLIVHKKRI